MRDSEEMGLRASQRYVLKISQWIRVLAWLAFLGQGFMILSLPLPLSRVDSHSPLVSPQRFIAPVRIEGTELTVSRHAHGLSIDASDGGGAGIILLPKNEPLTDQSLISVEKRTPHLFIVRVKVTPASEHVYFARIDENGVRQDDSFADRVSARAMRIFTLGLLGIILVVSSVNARRRPTPKKAESPDDAP